MSSEFDDEPAPAKPLRIQFRVYGVPATKGSRKNFHHKQTGKIISLDDNENLKSWAQEIASVARTRKGGSAWEGPISADFVFFLPKPQYVVKKEKRRIHCWPSRKPDLDKLLRAAKDAMTKILYQDDAQIVREYVEKVYDDEPGVEITLNLLQEAP